MPGESKGEGEKKTKIRFGFKTLVRAISPLIRGGQTSQSSVQSEEHEEDYSNFYWDLSNVDIKTALRNFYRQYNPEKSFIVGEIAQKYEGDEILLLQQLCERYNLSEDDMQQYLDQAPSKTQIFDEKFRESANRRPNTSIFNKSKDSETGSRSSSADRRSPKVSLSSNRSKGRDRDDVESVQSSVDGSHSGLKRRPKASGNHEYEEKDDQSQMSSPTATAASVAAANFKFQSYYWDLSDVDVAKALKLLYKEYNPRKSPNTSVLEHKNNKEILHLLRQLCKRHLLTEAEMQGFLDKARKPVPSRQSLDSVEDEDLLALDEDNDMPKKPRSIQDSPSSSNMMTGRVISNPPDRNALNNYMRETSSSSAKPEILSQKPSQALMNYYASPALNDNSFQSDNGALGSNLEQDDPRESNTTLSSLTPPQPPPSSTRSQVPNPNNRPMSVPAKSHAPFSVQPGGSFIIQDTTEDDQSANTNRFSVDYLKPTLPDGSRLSYGPIIRELRSKEEAPATSSQTPSQIKAAEREKKSQSEKKSLLAKNPSNDSANKQFSIAPEISSTVQVHRLSDPKPTPSPTPAPAAVVTTSPPNTNTLNPEIDMFRQELLKAQQQISDMSKENALVMSLLKQGNFNLLNNSTVTGSLFNPASETSQMTTQTPAPVIPKEHKGVQAEDLTLKTELGRARAKVNSLEGKKECTSLVDDLVNVICFCLLAQVKSAEKAFDVQIKENQEMKEEIESLQSAKQDLLLDKADLLQLLNILATAPVPAKNVLESYLTKLAGTLPMGSPQLREKVFDSKSTLPIGDRIHYLLQWKRSQEKTNQSQKKKSKKKEEEEEESNMNEEFQEGNGKKDDSISESKRSQSPTPKSMEDEDSAHSPSSPNFLVSSTTEYQKYEGKDLLLSLSKKDKLLLGDEDDAQVESSNGSVVSPKERKQYERINVGGLNPPEKKTTSAPSSRSTTPNTTRRTKRSKEAATSSTDQQIPVNTTMSDPFSNTASSVTSSTGSLSDKQKNDLLNEQYDLARKYYSHQQSQAKLSEQLNQTNLMYQELETSRVMKEAITNTNNRGASPQRLSTNNNDTTNALSSSSSSKPVKKEWIECFDPKSQRKYYYNTVLKKSTWKNPFNDTVNNTDNNGNTRSTSPVAPNRDPSPYGTDGGREDNEERNGKGRNNDERQYDAQGYPINNGKTSLLSFYLIFTTIFREGKK